MRLERERNKWKYWGKLSRKECWWSSSLRRGTHPKHTKAEDLPKETNEPKKKSTTENFVNGLQRKGKSLLVNGHRARRWRTSRQRRAKKRGEKEEKKLAFLSRLVECSLICGVVATIVTLSTYSICLPFSVKCSRRLEKGCETTRRGCSASGFFLLERRWTSRSNLPRPHRRPLVLDMLSSSPALMANNVFHFGRVIFSWRGNYGYYADDDDGGRISLMLDDAQRWRMLHSPNGPRWGVTTLNRTMNFRMKTRFKPTTLLSQQFILRARPHIPVGLTFLSSHRRQHHKHLNCYLLFTIAFAVIPSAQIHTQLRVFLRFSSRCWHTHATHNHT